MKTRDEQLSIFALRTLHVIGPIGLRVEDLLVRCRTQGWPKLTTPELEHELSVLGNKSLVMPFVSAMGAERWKVTALGTAALQEQGLA